MRPDPLRLRPSQRHTASITPLPPTDHHNREMPTSYLHAFFDRVSRVLSRRNTRRQRPRRDASQSIGTHYKSQTGRLTRQRALSAVAAIQEGAAVDASETGTRSVVQECEIACSQVSDPFRDLPAAATTWSSERAARSHTSPQARDSFLRGILRSQPVDAVVSQVRRIDRGVSRDKVRVFGKRHRILLGVPPVEWTTPLRSSFHGRTGRR
jgi:hypothetical protein